MIVLYPSHSFETLPSDRTEVEAGELLAAWTASFHPALIEKTGEIPRWESAAVPPCDVSKHPRIIPPCCESFLDEDWFRSRESGGDRLVRHRASRDEILAELFRLEEIDRHGFDDDYVADFFALGTAYFLVDLIVHQMQYTGMMDDSQLHTQVFLSLRAYRRENLDEARSALNRAFEVVQESKEYLYPIESHLLDLTLLTPTTAGPTFRKQLRSGRKLNLFLPSSLLRELPQREPETFAALQSAVEAGTAHFVFDDTETCSLRLLPILDVADRILEGVSVYRESLGRTPAIYGRLHAGLTPLLPQLLAQSGVRGIVYFAPLDGWCLKEPAQSKMIWQGADGTKIDALIRYPLDGSSDLAFFELVDRLGDTMHGDHAATVVFAQFPGQAKDWLEALRRVSDRVPVVGSFATVDEYFEATSRCGEVRSPGFAKYPDNALTEAVAAGESDPISRWNTVHRESVERTARSALGTVCALLGKPVGERPELEAFADAVTEGRDAESTPSPPGLFVANPWSFPRRVFLDVSDWPSLPPETPPVVLARRSGGRKELVVDVPSLGYVYLEPDASDRNPTDSPDSTAAARKSRGLFGLFKRPTATPASESELELVCRAEDRIGKETRRPVFLLRNEHFEAKFDADSGKLRSIFTKNFRFNRLSRQLGFRLPREQRQKDPRPATDANRGYAVMVADDITVEQSGPITGRLRISGRLVGPDGAPVARFVETATIRRRSRMLEFDLSLEPLREESEPPWDAYFALRYAWNDNTLDLRGGLGDGVHPISTDRIQAPRFVDLRGEKQSLTFFTEGLPFHRRFGERQLDTILHVRDESMRRFRSGVGVDLLYPVPVSLEFSTPKDSLSTPWAARPGHPSAWLFQIEARNVVALYWEPIFEATEEHDAETPERATGFRVFLLETEGRRAHFALHSFLPPRSAAATNLLEEKIKELKVDGDRILIDMHGHELLPLRVVCGRP